jgi:hypothetical protein
MARNLIERKAFSNCNTTESFPYAIKQKGVSGFRTILTIKSNSQVFYGIWNHIESVIFHALATIVVVDILHLQQKEIFGTMGKV